MSAFSMTGFGRGEAQGARWAVVVEIKTVNNRFKDFRFKMGSLLSSLEHELRGRLDREFKRGTFDVSVNWQRRGEAAAEANVDPRKVEAWLAAVMPLIKQYDVRVSPTDFLRADFARDEESDRGQELQPLVAEAFGKAVEALKASRREEGGNLVQRLLEHLSAYERLLVRNGEIKSLYPDLVRERLTGKLKDTLKEFKVDDGRLMQEVAFYLERLDIDEEIDRARIHLGKLRDTLKAGGEVGRQADFLLQELGRETNTMGSKSAHQELSQNVVEMKVQLEKVREQALNLE